MDLNGGEVRLDRGGGGGFGLQALLADGGRVERWKMKMYRSVSVIRVCTNNHSPLTCPKKTKTNHSP